MQRPAALLRHALPAVLVLCAAARSAEPRAPRKDRPAPEATSVGSIQALPGFQVERLYSVPAEQGSWVSLTFDPRGRLLTCDQHGGLYRVTPPPLGSGESPRIEPLKAPIGGAHGLLYAFDSLYVTNNEARGGESGLYRLRDSDGDDQFDQVELLRRIEGKGEHGPHGIALGPDGKSLYLVAGNFTKIPQPESSLVPRVWQEDQLLPRLPDAGGHDPHILAPAGWIARTDPDGQRWELVAVGFRNAYDLAFNHDGELFAFDSDMEWDIGAPWYRPTRVCHVVGGAEFGFRNGAGKWPAYQPDSVPPVVDIGPGSPTGILFGYGAKFPAKYQEALYLLDWSYGAIYAAHLEPRGASYTATFEKFLSGTPLPVTDLAIGPDGAMYFAIGGRRTQSGLYRVSYRGNEPTQPAKVPVDAPSAELRALRRQLEALHGKASSGAVAQVWPHLGHADRFIRYAARTALEHQPLAQWQSQALAERDPTRALSALLALVRCGDRALQGELLARLAAFDRAALDARQRLDLLRLYTLCFTRMGKPDDKVCAQLAARLDAWLPADGPAANRELTALLVYLDSPQVVRKTLDLMTQAPTQEEQIQLAMVLRLARAGWTPELRAAYFRWYQRAASFRGGHSFAGFLRNMREEAKLTLSAEERAALGPLLDDVPLGRAPQPKRPHVKDYTFDELWPLLNAGLAKRNFDRGRAMFSAAHCFNCHRFADEGGIGGPDLTALSGRLSPRDLLESIVNPDQTISDQYQATTFVLDDGRQVTGRIVNAAGDNLMIVPNLLAPDDIVSVNRKLLVESVPSKVSPMPSGLLNTLQTEEILDLMAYLLSRGDRQHSAFD